jgi:hypothetical protein
VWRGEEPVECGVGVRVRGPLYGAGPGEGSRMATAGARRGISCSELGVGQGLKTWLVFFKSSKFSGIGWVQFLKKLILFTENGTVHQKFGTVY